MARLLQSAGPVERDFARAINAWVTAAPGAEFQVGDAIRTGVAASARLNLDDGSLLGLEEGTLIRFLDRQPGAGEQALDLQMGTASLEASPEGSVLRTAFGVARLDAGSRVQLSRAGPSLRYEVLVGAAVVENAEGGTLRVSQGQIVAATLGEAVMDLIGPEAPSQEPVEPAPIEVALGTGEIRATITGTTVLLGGPGDTRKQALVAGERALEAGSVVEVGRGSRVSLRRGHERAELGSGGTFVIGSEGHLVAAQSGTVTVSSDHAVRIQVPGGFIVTRSGQARVTAEGRRGTRVEVQAGTVTLSGKNSEDLNPGQEGRIAPDGLVSVRGRGVGRSDLDVTAGQSLVVHDPRPPTAIGFLFGDYCRVGTIRLEGKSAAIAGEDFAKGEGRVALAIGPGSVSYSLHCVDEQAAEGPARISGKISVIADAGTRPVPKQAPSTFVEVNGRNYTVLYQNQLPQVTVRWSGAPDNSSGYTVQRSSPGLSRSYKTSSPTYTFPSGMLGEGTHQIYFEGAGRVSRRTSITISFDNATPTASLQTPASTGVGPGGTLPIVGTALPGWTVTVDGKPVGQDADGRFSVNASMPTDGRPTAVRLTHPSRGSHVYLRRPAGAR